MREKIALLIAKDIDAWDTTDKILALIREAMPAERDKEKVDWADLESQVLASGWNQYRKEMLEILR